jgi:hypothetical protein
MKDYLKIMCYGLWCSLLAACGGTQSTEAAATVPPVQEEAPATPTSTPRVVEAGVDGRLRLTAENGVPIGPEIKYMPEWKAFGWFTAADRVEWEVNVPKGGDYAMELEWSVSDEEAGKVFLFRAGSAQLTGTVAKSGSWETFKKETVGRLPLTEGLQKVVFQSQTQFEKGALLDLRALTLVPVK